MAKNITEYAFTPENPDFETKEYAEDTRKKMLEYLKSAEYFAVGGHVYDCIEKDEAKDTEAWFEKDGFTWSTNEIYHIENYGASVTDDFMNFIQTI